MERHPDDPIISTQYVALTGLASRIGWIALAFALFLAVPCRAQGITYGIELGVSRAHLVYRDAGALWLGEDFRITEESREGRTALTAAVTASVPGGVPGLSFRTGVRYSDLGDRHDFALDGFFRLDGRRTLSQRYVSLPLLVQYFLPETDLFVAAGAEVGVLVHASDVMVYQVIETSEHRPIDPNRFNAVVLTAVGIEFDAWSHPVRIALQYGHGVVATYESPQRRFTRERGIAVGYGL